MRLSRNLFVGLTSFVALTGCEPHEVSNARPQVFVPSGKEMQALLDKVTLSKGTAKLGSTHWADWYGNLVQVGPVLVDCSVGKLRGFDAKSWDQVWETPVPEGRSPTVLASDERYVYFIVFPADEKMRWKAKAGTLHVLQASNGKLVRELPAVKANAASRYSAPSFTAAAPYKDTIALLSSQTAEDDSGRVTEGQYSVQLVELDSWKTRWTKHYMNKTSRGDSRGFLMASAYPNYSDAGVNGLAWAQDELLVTGGDRDPILSLSKADGSTKGRIDKPWEYQRGFTGPSVWAHHIGRWGSWGSGDDDIKPSEASAKFYQMYEGSIVAGPAVAKGVNEYPERPSIFVVVALEPKGIWSGYLARPILYEFTTEGRPLSMVDLPRLPLGTSFKALDSSLLWAGQNDSMFRFDSASGSVWQMGPGSSDLITKISWYRQYEPSVREGVLASKWKPTDVAFYKRHAFRALAGGVVLKKEDKHICFPIGVVDLDTGTQTRIDLQVPVTKSFVFPTSNYSSEGGKATASGPLDIGLTGFVIAGNTLRCVLATQTWHGTVDFDAGKVLDLANSNP